MGTEFSELPSHALSDSIAAVRGLTGRTEQVGTNNTWTPAGFVRSATGCSAGAPVFSDVAAQPYRGFRKNIRTSAPPPPQVVGYDADSGHKLSHAFYRI